MNAIILAAGLGGRLGDMTKFTPKPLIKVGESSIIERQIMCLREIGIEDIHVVVGHLHHEFSFLRNKYQVEFIYNPEYKTFNNIYSLYVCQDFFGDSYVLEGDVYLNKNFLKRHVAYSTYFSGVKENIQHEWILEFDKRQKVLLSSLYINDPINKNRPKKKLTPKYLRPYEIIEK